MSEVPRLLKAFSDGHLIRPSADAPNTVDLARSVASLCGAVRVDETPAQRDISQLIGSHEHIVFVLVDGLGMHLVDQESPASIFRTHLKATLHAVFPTSTAPSLTSIATGEWPAVHAIPGWFTYLPEPDITATILPFVERFSKEDARTAWRDPYERIPDSRAWRANDADAVARDAGPHQRKRVFKLLLRIRAQRRVQIASVRDQGGHRLDRGR